MGRAETDLTYSITILAKCKKVFGKGAVSAQTYSPIVRMKKSMISRNQGLGLAPFPNTPAFGTHYGLHCALTQRRNLATNRDH